MPHHPNDILYSEKYADSMYEHRHVILPKAVMEDMLNITGGKRILEEDEWHCLDMTQSRGTVHYKIHQPEPHILLFRRPLGTDPVVLSSRRTVFLFPSHPCFSEAMSGWVNYEIHQPEPHILSFRRPLGNIEYSNKYADSMYEYRHVILRNAVMEDMLKITGGKRILEEDEWRGLAITQSSGWVHYEIHQPEPHILFFRRPLGTDPLMPHHPSDIEYSDKYADSMYEYRRVILPKAVMEDMLNITGGKRILEEDEWRGLAITQSRGWVHYEIRRHEPHILLFRRPLGTDPITGKIAKQDAAPP